jgi:formamidopyrimidine-DNA glycosylase
MDIINIETEERKAGNIAKNALKASLVTQIKNTFHRRSGELEKSTVNSRMKDGRLDRLTINSPHYSFKQHFGSRLTGTQKATERKQASVKSFQRHLEGKTSSVSAHTRMGGAVKALNKNIDYKAHNHIAKALNQTNALEVLATSLGNNRMVLITSQIDF